MQTLKILCALCLLSMGSASAQIGATREQVEARHIDPDSDFAFSYTLSPRGYVIFEQWSDEEHHYGAKIALHHIEPMYTWKERGTGSDNWFGAASGKPPLHALFYRARAEEYLFIASLADAPDKGKGGWEVWDYAGQLEKLCLPHYQSGQAVQETPAWPTPYSTPVQETPAWPTPAPSKSY